MAKILRFPGAPAPGGDPSRRPSTYGLKRVRRRPRGRSRDQMDLFAGPRSTEVLPLPGAAAASFERALAFDEAGDQGAARAGYLACIEAGESAPDAWCNLGILEFTGGDSREAFDCFRQALKQDPRHWESHYNLGNLFFEAEEADSARLHWELAADIEPGFANVHYNLGLVLGLQEEFAAAVSAVERFCGLASEAEAEAAAELLDTLRTSRIHAEARTSPAD